MLTDDKKPSMHPYACPVTQAALWSTGDTLETADGEHVYPVENGIPNFLQYPPRESQEVEERLSRINEKAVAEGWESALRQLDSAGFRYTTERSRGRYLDLLDLEAKKVLEVGASKGQHSALIAERTASLHTLDVIRGQAKFANVRMKQLGLSGVQVAVGGDSCRLPYIEDSFDTLIMNYVFEWSASRDEGEDFETGQRRMLSEANRVLRPGGVLFLSTKNRYFLRLLGGGVDEHTEMRFGNALPRWLMMLRLRRRGMARPHGLLHSYGKLRSMFRDAGFGEMRCFWAIPDARHPKAYVEFGPDLKRRVRDEMASQSIESKLTRYLLRLPGSLIPHVVPSHVFIATAQGLPGVA